MSRPVLHRCSDTITLTPLTSSWSAWSQVQCTREIKLKVSEICSLLEVDGIRGDMVINRAARALVAMEGRDEVTLDDVKKVIGICLNHRSLPPLPSAYRTAAPFLFCRCANGLDITS